MKAIIDSPVICPSCDGYMRTEGDAVACSNSDCEAFGVKYERPSVALKAVKAPENEADQGDGGSNP